MKRIIGQFEWWFLRRFSKFRIIENINSQLVKQSNDYLQEKITLQKKTKSDAALITSLNRYIAVLESRDKERVSRIEELEAQRREYLKTIKELREHLSGIAPHKEETS